MLLLLPIVFSVTTVYRTSRISAPGFQAVNFAQAKERRKLNGSVIKQVYVRSEDECSLQCVRNERCLSYNFENTKNESGTFACELSNSDRFSGLGNFTEHGNFTYRGIQSICESSINNPCGNKGICIPDYFRSSFECKCYTGYGGIPCKEMKSCLGLSQNGFTSNGVYHIIPDSCKPIQVLCDMSTDGGGWTVFQRRLDGSVDFWLDWKSYKNGFGDLSGEFWLGNDNLHCLTANHDVMLRIDLEDFDGKISYAEYSTFKVADGVDKYRIAVGGYNGTAGDSMTDGVKFRPANNMQFTTKDADNDGSSVNCAETQKGGWWYNACSWANPNGVYYSGKYSNQDADGVKWVTLSGHYYSFKRIEMKVKPKV